MSDGDSSSSTTGSTGASLLGIDPLHFSAVLFALLILFVLYLLLPRGFRIQYCGAYPKRYAWSARRNSSSLRRSSRGGITTTQGGGGSTTGTGSSSIGTTSQTPTGTTITNTTNVHPHHRQLQAQGIGLSAGVGAGSVGTYSSSGAAAAAFHDAGHDPHHPMSTTSTSVMQQNTNAAAEAEIVISAAMQQLRDPGVLIVAHGSRGKPKTVRLQLTEVAITWRTETRKKSSTSGTTSSRPKMGKLHQVPLSHIMYVDVGKQTTALRRVENASVSDSLCFSLLTKEGSLDLEANSARERDALVSCFSLVLDEVHAQNWRDIYRGPSSDNMPSSFDDYDTTTGTGQQVQQQQQHHDPTTTRGGGGPQNV